MGVAVLITIILLVAGGYSAYTQHCKNQNARDVHRAIKTGQSLPGITSQTHHVQVDRSTSSTVSIADELEKLTKLHNAGALSDEEFEEAKKHTIKKGAVSSFSATRQMDNSSFDSSKFVDIGNERRL